MKLGVALALVIAFPTVAAAQYGFQLRPSPYLILSGSEQSANTRGPSIERVTPAVTPVSERARADDVRPTGRESDVTGSTPAPRY
jgi:hypothetical protein